jgi:broad specificity phosphatase PhoE
LNRKANFRVAVPTFLHNVLRVRLFRNISRALNFILFLRDLYTYLMLKIFLARHGQNVDNVNGILNGHRDEPLTVLGEEQAHTTAAYIKESGLTFDKIYSSPLVRAYKTAEIISEDLGLPKPEIEEDLIERDFGVMTGQPISKIEELCAPNIIKTETITYFLSPKDGETFPQVVRRAKRLLTRIQSEYENGSILLVTHGDIGKVIYSAYYSVPWEGVLTSFHFGNCELLLLSPESPPEEAHFFKQLQYN